jgi:hypothetical protein
MTIGDPTSSPGLAGVKPKNLMLPAAGAGPAHSGSRPATPSTSSPRAC